ncbi:orotate phosphoribosyltransferase [Eubacterium barkeri]|uniref:Orotate phosphoribosyltransferase n=2 Tax=Eubacterium barkeri TaxID=1528 RepID=A0A1H3BFZ1_EUBBA|nr:orotate phosphoribosyltransferase [Eubacterium barkeri]SDX40284.1 orotate phosphoribosyltransferase [Eubacterium barkeri]
MGYKEEFIDFMVRSGVLTFGDFVTKSGRKTPYFVNTGNYRTSEQIAKLGSYYAACIAENLGNTNFLYGPAYKGIPLVITASVALYNEHQCNIPYCFNRKEAKDHGEGGNIIGYKPQVGDIAMIIEDVITAGSSVRESVPLLKGIADVKVNSLIISVDRMEKGTGGKTAIQEVAEEFGITTYPIVTVREIIAHLHNHEVDGKIIIDDAMKDRMEAHLDQFGV